MSPVFGHGRLRLYLLKLLDENPRHGYDIIRQLEDRFMGLYAPSAGTVYPRLQRLESEGLVTRTEEPDGRKVYRITEAGREELRRRADDLRELEEELRVSLQDLAKEIRNEVRGSVRNLREELKQAARDMRRQQRHATREARCASGEWRELVSLLEQFRFEAGYRAREWTPTPEQLSEIREIVQDALRRIREVLERR